MHDAEVVGRSVAAAVSFDGRDEMVELICETSAHASARIDANGDAGDGAGGQWTAAEDEEDEDGRHVGILDARHNLYLVARGRGDAHASLAAVLWNAPSEDKEARFADLRRWYATRVGGANRTLVARDLESIEDHLAWYASFAIPDDNERDA